MTTSLPDSYPRPQFRRDRWQSLDGAWAFEIDSDGDCWSQPDQVPWTMSITVPFSPETPASGVGDTSLFRACWYRRTFEPDRLGPHERLLLHLGAVDYDASVWVNDRLVARHQGGYTPIDIDITDQLTGYGPQTIVVRAADDAGDLTQPRGKQDWKREPHAIWYPRTTGIWQSIWLEPVSETHIDQVRWISNLERWEIALDARITEPLHQGLQLGLVLRAGETLLANDRFAVVSGEVHRRIVLSDPGIDDFRNELLWRPGSPTLIDAELTLYAGDGGVIDRVESYTALRTVGVQGDAFVLNGRPLKMRMVLDQGYWPETGLTPPDDDAIRRDVELALAMGFNGVRKHQKIEDPRYLTWADRLGLLVWEEMPSVYRFTRQSVERLTNEWMRVLDRDSSHPCIVAWVPFNESWGVPDLPANPAQRDCVRALYHLTKTLDPTRPVIGNDGWESLATDIVGIHDYDANLPSLRTRYAAADVPHDLLRRQRPAGRVLTIDGHPHAGQPLMLTEFGGIACTPPEEEEDTWGYARSDTGDALARAYAALLDTVRGMEMFAGFCYTQFADTYQEANGLLTADRTPKFPIEEIARATCGPKRNIWEV